MYTIVGIISTVISILYIRYLIIFCETITANDHETKLETYHNMELLHHICSMTLNFIQILMSFVILCSKSLRFYGFHSDYRVIFCFLIPFQIIWACLGTTNYILRTVNDNWLDFWLSHDVEFIIFDTTGNFFFAVSMISQLSCLIFGYFRYR